MTKNINRKVYQYDFDGNFVAEYINCVSATFAITKKEKGSIDRCLRKGISTAYGFIWSYKYYMKVPTSILKKVKKTKSYLIHKYDTQKIYQYDLDGNLIKQYDNLKSITTNRIDRGQIKYCLSGELKTTLKSIWRFDCYKKLPETILEEHILKNNKILYLYDMEGNFINKYYSIDILSKYLNSTAAAVSKSIDGKKNKIHKNYIVRSDYYKKLPKTIVEFHLKNYKHVKRKISQYTLDGKFVKTYESGSDAARAIGISASNIHYTAKGQKRQKTAGGFIWKYEN